MVANATAAAASNDWLRIELPLWFDCVNAYCCFCLREGYQLADALQSRSRAAGGRPPSGAQRRRAPNAQRRGLLLVRHHRRQVVELLAAGGRDDHGAADVDAVAAGIKGG